MHRRIRGGKAGVFRSDLRDDGPVAVVVTATDGGEETIADYAGDRQGDALRFGGLQDEANIFEAECDDETGRLKFSFEDQTAVGFVDGSVEERAGEKVQERCGIYAGLARERDGFAERFENGGDHEIAGELDDVGLGGFVADDEKLGTEGFEERLAAVHGGFFTGGDDGEFGGFGGVWTAEHGSGDERLADTGVGVGEFVSERDADGAAGDVNAPAGERGENAVSG